MSEISTFTFIGTIIGSAGLGGVLGHLVTMWAKGKEFKLKERELDDIKEQNEKENERKNEELKIKIEKHKAEKSSWANEVKKEDVELPAQLDLVFTTCTQIVNYLQSSSHSIQYLNYQCLTNDSPPQPLICYLKIEEIVINLRTMVNTFPTFIKDQIREICSDMVDELIKMSERWKVYNKMINECSNSSLPSHNDVRKDEYELFTKLLHDIVKDFDELRREYLNSGTEQ